MKKLNIKYLLLPALAFAVPLIFATAMLHHYASDEYSGAYQTFKSVIYGVAAFSLVMGIVALSKYRYAAILSIVGSQLGLAMHLTAEYRSSPPIRIWDNLMWSNWIVVLGVLGLVVGLVFDLVIIKKRPKQK